MDGFTAKDPLFNAPLNTPSFAYGSEAANLEYSILTAILGPSPENNPISDSHSSASPPPVHPFSTSSSEYAASWTSAPGNSLLHSEIGFHPSPLLTVGGIQTTFGDSQLTLPFTDRSQTVSGSSSTSDLLSQTFTSIDPGSSATSSSAHLPQQDSFTTSAHQSMSPSLSALNPLALGWSSSADSA
jgi:hypothetical protein